MPQLYPFLLVPEFHERVWGTRDLRPVYTRVVGPEPIGEAWLTGDSCRIAQGPLSGRTLDEIACRYGAALTGHAARQPNRFPILVKFLFPRERLSVQVHPDDEQARARGQACGKTECWYVLSADPGTQVAVGLNRGVTKPELAQAISQKRAEDLLNWIDIAAGDVIYVDAGTVHAIGGGAVIVETQQNSDTTYRLYDYGRPREIHVEAGLAVSKERTNAGKVCYSGSKVVACPHFIVERFAGAEPVPVKSTGGATVQILVLTRGSAIVESQGMEPLSFIPGEAVVIPAEWDTACVKPHWDCELLRMSLPVEGVSEPETQTLW